MTIEIRTAEPDDFDALLVRDQQAFGHTMRPEERSVWRALLDLDRFRLAFDDGEIVGAAGSHALDITMPGGAVLPMAGTTWVSVAPTHRRQGVLRRLMGSVHDDIDARGEPLAGLSSSEGAIYERFGYGVATRWRHVEIDRRRVQMSDRFRPEAGTVRLVDPVEHLDAIASIYDRFRRGRVGEVSRTAEWIRMRIGEVSGRPQAALHTDGYALWSITADWNDFDVQHELGLVDLIACTPDAHAALWHLILSHDLVGPVRSSRAVTLDDPLPHLLTDQRAVRTTSLHDFLWLCPRRVGDVLAARRYRVADELVVGIVEDVERLAGVDGDRGIERWAVSGGPDGASVEPSSKPPDLVMTRAAMGAVVLGGVTPTELARGGRLASTIALDRADAFFGWSPSPHCSTPF